MIVEEENKEISVMDYSLLHSDVVFFLFRQLHGIRFVMAAPGVGWGGLSPPEKTLSPP
jgi:hypothetical protein